MSIHSDDCVIITDDDVITNAPSSTMSLRAGSGHFPSISFLIRKSQLALHHTSAIFALDEGTILRVFSGCFTTRDDTKACEVRIPVGYCIIFRGDLISNGMPYAATNHRIHCYLS
ncbi:hypothetical protein F442_22368 [Phytophthora nicotianae P10297]|uniref:Uncharacterized protein n=1 Tax=Phytophthora nicotianae P10297 TaxID=1317064 RepID=W2Y2B5_PHYNI|nr:hypothetical protein F442_22368 [Phytophthora nicotianae P10297]